MGDVEQRHRAVVGVQGLNMPMTAVAIAEIATLVTAAWLTDRNAAVGAVSVLGTMLLALVTISSVTPVPSHRAFVLVLMLPLLSYLLRLGLPAQAFPQPSRGLFVAVLLLCSAVLVLRRSGMSRRDVGIAWPCRRHLGVESLAVFAGVATATALFVVQRPRGFDADGLAGTSAIVLALGATAFIEEFLFRGVLLTATLRVVTFGRGLVYTSVLYGMLSLGHQSLPTFVLTSLAAGCFGLVARRTGSIIGVAVAHAAILLTLYVALPRFFQ